MSDYDYNLVLQVFAGVLGKSDQIDYSAGNRKLEQFDITLSDGLSNNVRCHVSLKKYDMLIEINAGDVSKSHFEELLPKFEYEMEQKFLRNIKLATSTNKEAHNLTIEF